jgi:hypothetical protein
MKTKIPFSPKQSTGKNFDVATFGKHAANPLAALVFSEVASWPKAQSTVKLGKIEDARVYDLLRILIPALCQRDPAPFRLFADAIDAVSSAAYPASRLDFFILMEAASMVRDSKALPISQSEFKRRVEKRSGLSIDSGQFHRVYHRLGFTCATDPKRGGRPKTKG